jgi:hypothetical protein
MRSPRRCGLEVSPLTAYRVVEVARLDGSTGWCVFIGASSAVSGAFLADHAAEDMFGRDPLGVTGASLLVSGRRWSRRTAISSVVAAIRRLPAWWLLALCQVIDGDQPA